MVFLFVCLFYFSLAWPYSFVNCGQVVSRMCLITFCMELCNLFNSDLCISVLILVMLGDRLWGGWLLGACCARIWWEHEGGVMALFLPPSLPFFFFLNCSDSGFALVREMYYSFNFIFYFLASFP